MVVKHEWRKHEKSTYLPKSKPDFIDVPAFNFITLRGQSNPSSELFADQVGALYSLAYGLKMGLKKRDVKPEGYSDFTVYPLEGVWDITDEAKITFTGKINKDDLLYTLMIRQPDFIDESLFNVVREQMQASKPSKHLAAILFERIEEGCCVQMLHSGPFENESASFALMESFAEREGFSRKSKIHKEIYLTDARRVNPEKYKTVLRFSVEPRSIA